MLEVSFDNCRKKGLIYTKLYPKPTNKINYILFFLFVTILTQSLFTFVRCNLMSLAFFSTWHNRKVFMYKKV